MKRRTWSTPPPPAKPRAQRRPAGGIVVNPRIKLPKPPGGWVDEEKNYVTGELFKDFHPHIGFAEGAARIRQEARNQGIEGGGYRSRGPVLWAMHVLKLEAWYLRAMGDGAAWDPVRRRPLTLRARKPSRPRRVRPVDPHYDWTDF